MKQQPKESVLHDWVHELPFTQQALLLLSLRGPDGLPKETAAKHVLHYLRGCILKSAYANFDGSLDGFMRTDYVVHGIHTRSFHIGDWTSVTWHFYSDVDTLPHHFFMHLLHAVEVVGYKHPDEEVRAKWYAFYKEGCKSFHMTPETEKELDERLKY